ncbi:uncharacterized protein IUM83_00082 [Phytophthora cinnamomi]|uniref:uncharacterized protein n=1 Tax=Phytophthora cinnamomi TaxID=4785 RepID=UPI00355A53D0|nr:hypothetical protein IUM83_00082 [Phytophthora cinnamomi]
MDVILSRAGLSAAQQRSVCFGALKDEVQQAEAKLADTFAALQRLREVARVAKDVHNAQASIVKLPPSVTMAVKRMTQVGRSIGPLLEEVRSSLNAFTAPGGYFGYEGSSAGEEDEEDDEQGAPSRWMQRRAAAATASHLRQSSSFAATSREKDVATFEQERQRNREKLEASGLRDLLDLTKRVEDTFPASAARFKWCSTQLRKFVTAKYKKPAQVTLDDQNKLESIVAETRGWTDSYPEESTVRDSWKPTLAYATTNQGFCSLAEVDEGFEQMAKAQEEKHFEFLALTAYTFLATAALTQNQAVLRSYQTLEKVLYLMRIMMHRRPEYQQCSTSTVDTLLSLFPPSQRPSFKYPSIAKSMAENGEETDED